MLERVSIVNQSNLNECRDLLSNLNSFSIRHTLSWPNHKPLEISQDAIKKITNEDKSFSFFIDDVLLFKVKIGDSYYVDSENKISIILTRESLTQPIEYLIWPIDNIPYTPLTDFSCHRVPHECLNHPKSFKPFYVDTTDKGRKYIYDYEKSINNRDHFYEKDLKNDQTTLNVQFWSK